LSRDGSRVAYGAAVYRRNFFRVPFDAATGRAGPREPVTTGSRFWAWGDVSPDGQRLALAQSFIGQEDIYVSDTNGSGLRQLTDDPFNDRNPRWAPDGSRIAFYSNRSGNYEIWTVAPDGGALQQVTASEPRSALYPTWSPDGLRLMFTDYDSSTSVIDPRTPWQEQTPQVLPEVPAGKRFFRPYSWSPDGRRVAGDFYVGSELVVYDVQRQEYGIVAPAGDNPAWAGDDRLVYTHGRDLRLLDVRTGRSAILLTVDENEELAAVRVTADARFIYLAIAVSESDIWLAEFGGGKPQ
jgi:dipeptidyl aminopeptidase/acylaminoacyl peptidase